MVAFSQELSNQLLLMPKEKPTCAKLAGNVRNMFVIIMFDTHYVIQRPYKETK